MNQEELKAKMEEALKDKAFVQALADAEDAKAAQEIFASKGFEFTVEEVEAIARQIRGEEGELGDDQLEAVSGGIAAGICLLTPILIAAAGSVISKWIKW